MKFLIVLPFAFFHQRALRPPPGALRTHPPHWGHCAPPPGALHPPFTRVTVSLRRGHCTFPPPSGTARLRGHYVCAPSSTRGTAWLALPPDHGRELCRQWRHLTPLPRCPAHALISPIQNNILYVENKYWCNKGPHSRTTKKPPVMKKDTNTLLTRFTLS